MNDLEDVQIQQRWEHRHLTGHLIRTGNEPNQRAQDEEKPYLPQPIDAQNDQKERLPS